MLLSEKIWSTLTPKLCKCAAFIFAKELINILLQSLFFPLYNSISSRKSRQRTRTSLLNWWWDSDLKTHAEFPLSRIYTYFEVILISNHDYTAVEPTYGPSNGEWPAIQVVKPKLSVLLRTLLNPGYRKIMRLRFTAPISRTPWLWFYSITTYLSIFIQISNNDTNLMYIVCKCKYISNTISLHHFKADCSASPDCWDLLLVKNKTIQYLTICEFNKFHSIDKSVEARTLLTE